MANKYKIGQKVMIRPDLECGQKYFMEDGVSCNGVNSDMVQRKGKIATITNYTRTVKYQIDLDKGAWTWTDEMFIPIVASKDELFESLVKGNITESDYEALLKMLPASR